ncbi:hypothetical protein [Streptomyces sp. NPDC048436]|uniref:hypothetical protein n=1 Tax=Streptomyces sp. NPDC048436 TaxID=3365550 RepID=UPI0037247058
MRYVIEVFRSPGGVHGNVVDEDGQDGGSGLSTPFHGWLELLSLLEPPPEHPEAAETPAPEDGELFSATGDDSCDA